MNQTIISSTPTGSSAASREPDRRLTASRVRAQPEQVDRDASLRLAFCHTSRPVEQLALVLPQGGARRSLGVILDVQFGAPVSQSIVEPVMEATAIGLRSAEMAKAALGQQGVVTLAFLPRWLPLEEMRTFNADDERTLCSAHSVTELTSYAYRWVRKLDTPLKRISSHAYCLIGISEARETRRHAGETDGLEALADAIRVQLHRSTGWESHVAARSCDDLQTAVSEGRFRQRLARLGDVMRLHARSDRYHASVQIETSQCGHAAIVRIGDSDMSGHLAYKIEGVDGTNPDRTAAEAVKYIAETVHIAPVLLPSVTRSSRIAMLDALEQAERPLLLRL